MILRREICDACYDSIEIQFPISEISGNLENSDRRYFFTVRIKGDLEIRNFRREKIGRKLIEQVVMSLLKGFKSVICNL